MADREFVFGRPDVQKLLRENFVLVAADDWYQRRQDDALGRFFRMVADQGPRKGQGGRTRQGRYAFTASGKLLVYNNNRDPERILRMLHESLARFESLPADERAPGAVKVPGLDRSKIDPRYARIPPQDGLVVKVHTRVLDQDENTGKYIACGKPGENTDTFRHNGFGVATDHLWIKGEEVKQLLASLRAQSGPVDLPKPVAMRIARFHLVDDTRGEPPHWKREEVRALTIHARHQPDQPGTIRIAGKFHLETADGERGYQGELAGILALDPATEEVKRFDVAALGRHWGEGPYTRGARPGKTPLGIVFTLGDPSKPEDRVPPQGIRWEDGYYRADLH